MLSIAVLGYEQLQIRLEKLVSAASVKEILDEAAAILLSRIRTHFLQQVDPDGNTWPVSDAALKRASSGGGGGTLFDTGRLFHSIQLAAATEDSRFIASDVPYGIYHQLGDTINGIRRVFLGFGDDDAAVASQLVVRRFEKALQ